LSHIGNFEIDFTQKTEVWSEGMYHILGIDRNHHQPTINEFLAHLHVDEKEYVTKAIRKSFYTYEAKKFEFKFYKANGELRYGYTQSQFEVGEDGVPLRLFGIFQDNTKQKLAELERNKMVKELTQRNKDLEDFAYIISHNLRAPVANILGASAILKEAVLTIEDEMVLKNGISQSAMKLDSVIKDLNHILDLKTTIGEQQEVVSFPELIRDIKNNINRKTDQKDINISCNFTAIDHLSTSKSYLYSIFYNLISNSIKYRKSDIPVQISISSKRTSTGVELNFTDNGIGIDLPKNGHQLFGLYQRFHHHVEGKGMGLFMVKTQVEALEGTIRVSSKINKGTTFSILL